MRQWNLVSFMVPPLAASQGPSSLPPGAPGPACLPLPTPLLQPLPFSAQGVTRSHWRDRPMDLITGMGKVMVRHMPCSHPATSQGGVASSRPPSGLA